MTEIFAHRGLHHDERENTVAAFLAAKALGVDGVELDVRRTIDGTLVVHHNAEIDGLVISEARPRDLPDFVPTFEEVLGVMTGLTLNVEIKNLHHFDEPTYDESGEFARQVVTHVRDAGWADSVIISCFDLATCETVRSFDPDIGLGWLLHWDLDVETALTLAHELGFNAVHPYFARVDATTAAWAHELRVALNVWTVNDPDDVEAMLALGVDAIITDEPAAAMALRQRRPPVGGPRSMI